MSIGDKYEWKSSPMNEEISTMYGREGPLMGEKMCTSKKSPMYVWGRSVTIRMIDVNGEKHRVGRICE